MLLTDICIKVPNEDHPFYIRAETCKDVAVYNRLMGNGVWQHLHSKMVETVECTW